jgi:hypothetical protein
MRGRKGTIGSGLRAENGAGCNLAAEKNKVLVRAAVFLKWRKL